MRTSFDIRCLMLLCFLSNISECTLSPFNAKSCALDAPVPGLAPGGQL